MPPAYSSWGTFNELDERNNAKLREIAARRLNTHVIDWNQIVADHVADGIISEDSVHPTPAGVKLLADAYVGALRDC